MRPICTRLALLATTLLLAAPAGAAPPAKAAARAAVEIDGAAVYRATCNRCHNARAVEELGPSSWEMVVTHMQVRGSLPARDMRALFLWMNPPDSGSSAEWPAAAALAFPDVPLVAERCARCHDVSRIEDAVAAQRDVTWWSATLRRMRSYGANLKPKEETSLREALTTRADGPKE